MNPSSNSATNYFLLWTMDTTDPTHLRVSRSTTLTSSTTVGNTANFITYLNKGYYAVIVYTDVLPSVTIQTWSDTYSCPFSSSYNDFFNIFTGCSFGPIIGNSNPGLPCLIYDYSNLVCTFCLPGYTIFNGLCFITPNCNSNQYFSLGVCYNASSTCGTFNLFTGSCITCITQAYYLSNGQCLPVNCGQNQYYSVKASGCISLPATCLNFTIST